MDHLARAKEELLEIEAQIDALQQRRQKLAAFIELGQSLFAEGGRIGVATEHSMALVLGNVNRRLAMQTARENSARARILGAVREHLELWGPTHTRDLLAELDKQGIEVGGADRLSALSVLLSKSGEFVSNRRDGWSVKAGVEAVEQKETPQDAPTSAGSE